MIELMLVIVFSILLGLAANTAAAVVPLSNEFHQANILNNVTEAPGLGVIDPRFTATYRQGQSSLSATSCLMSAVHAMMELALENFTEPLDTRRYIDPDYPDVVVALLVVWPRQSIQARYLLWGVWEGIRWMINHQSFKDLVIGAHWDGILMSNIWIRGASRHLSIAESNGTLGLVAQSEKTSIHNATVESTRDFSTVDARSALSDPDVVVTVTRTGETIGLTKVFTAIFAALEFMAHFSSTDEVVEFQIPTENEGTTIGILKYPRSSAARPPSLKYKIVLLSIVEIPWFMLQARTFTEMVVEISVDGVPLGEIFLSKSRLR